MRTRAQTVRLGIFVAIALGLFLGTLVVLSGTALLEQRDRYTILFSETVSGLEVGAAVKLLGVRVGRIESFRVRSDGVDKVDVTVNLDHGTPIRKNAKAVLSGSAITGLMFVEIAGGTVDADLIKPGGEILAEPSLLGSLRGRAENIAVKVDEILSRLLSLTEEENVTNLHQTLDNLQVATLKGRNILESLEGASARVEPLLAELNRAATSLRSASDAIGSVAGDTHKVAVNLEALTRADGSVQAAVEQLRHTLQTVDTLLGGDNAAQTSQEVRAALHSFTDTMNQLSSAVGSSGPNVQDISSSLRNAAEYLEEFARAIRENPSLLLRSTQEE